MTDRRDDVMSAIAAWVDRGWLRRLDAALARFVAELDPAADGVVLLSTALVAQCEGRGHTCLAIDALLADPADALQWTGDAAEELVRLMAALPRDADAWIDRLAGGEAIGFGDGSEPLVLHDRRLYLRRYFGHERRVAAAIAARLGAFDPVDEKATRCWLTSLFPEPPVAGEPDWQKIACAVALRGRLTIVTGGPGTGKTFTAARFLALLYATATHRDRLRIALAAPTGKAAARLEQSIAGALATLRADLGDAAVDLVPLDRIDTARTLHALLGTRPGTRRFRHDASNPLDVDVVVVDEASMVHVEMMDALLDALPARARVLLLGDKDQLASVEAGAVLGELCRDADRARYDDDTVRYVESVGGTRLPADSVDADGPPLAQQTVMLRHSRRFGGDIDTLARAVNAGDVEAATRLLTTRADGAVAWSSSTVVDLASHGRPGAEGGHRRYLDAVRRGPATPEAHSAWVREVLKAFDTFRVLCALREGEWGVGGLNKAIADRLAQDGLLTRSGEWYEGRPVIVTRNDYGLGVFNGDIGIALRGPQAGDGLRACFAVGDEVRSVGVGRLGAVETAFAMTVHKSQGSEFDHTLLVLPGAGHPVATRELAYTGITRARSAFTLVSAGPDGLADAIGRITRRSSGLLGFLPSAPALR